jgi:hypothetical protein
MEINQVRGNPSPSLYNALVLLLLASACICAVDPGKITLPRFASPLSSSRASRSCELSTKASDRWASSVGSPPRWKELRRADCREKERSLAVDPNCTVEINSWRTDSELQWGRSI